jgi:hypothetical protein
LDWIQNDNRSAVTAPVRRGIEKVQNSRFRRQSLSHLGTADADPLAVNDPNLWKSETLGLFQVIGQGIGDVLGPKGMQVERILDGYAPHPQSKI